jgi:hypothetical protein
VSTASDGPDPERVAEPVPQTGRPPVPRRLSSGAPSRAEGDDGGHRTEEVPFPLPPLPQVIPDSRPAEVPGPETGELDLGDYPPRVPGGLRSRPGTRPEGTGHDDGAPHEH